MCSLDFKLSFNVHNDYYGNKHCQVSRNRLAILRIARATVYKKRKLQYDDQVVHDFGALLKAVDEELYDSVPPAILALILFYLPTGVYNVDGVRSHIDHRS